MTMQKILNHKNYKKKKIFQMHVHFNNKTPRFKTILLNQ